MTTERRNRGTGAIVVSYSVRTSRRIVIDLDDLPPEPPSGLVTESSRRMKREWWDAIEKVVRHDPEAGEVIHKSIELSKYQPLSGGEE